MLFCKDQVTPMDYLWNMMQNLNFLWIDNFKDIPLFIAHVPERISSLTFDNILIPGSSFLWGQVLLSDWGFCEMTLIPWIKSLFVYAAWVGFCYNLWQKQSLILTAALQSESSYSHFTDG